MVRQDRARRTRERILDAAAQELAANGYARTTVQDVAGRIGMTKGALYGHFASKEVLAQALTEHAQAAIDELCADRAGAARPMEALAGFTSALGRCLHEDVRVRAVFRLQLDDREADPAPRGRLLGQLVEHLLGLLGRARQQGLLSVEHDPEDVAQLLLAVAFTVHYGPFPRSGHESARWTAFAWGLVARALAPEGRGTTE
ncbi:TetR family transcriptional regulator [Streptomyces sp. NPDC090036]|uniref:TetR family transcriptional regulator n=1 Tax=Streptomyces sp. NPDC090036 TaxID=3365926 RepID=UPI003812E8B3